ncbi:MAG: tRNA pseudouridine(55) synthase TruB [Cardiobacteriaceae bacterium]|nr:tRNA pseudouridine(55) synthase TruB [Cardiobacteriaceae bacterium]
MPKRDVSGVLLLDKPVAMTSNAAMQKARFLLQAEKAGHGGTLDPFATGVLPIFFGEAAKFANYFLDANKEYEARIKFGRETDSCDVTGKIIKTAEIPDLTAIDWQRIVQEKFTGKILQIPPIFSALKIDGKRAYELARNGKNPDIAAREINIFDLHILEIGRDFLSIRVLCSKGTYIRSLARDIGLAIGTCAYCEKLHRRATLGFNFQNSRIWQLAEIEKIAKENFAEIDACLLKIDFCLQHLDKYKVSSEKIKFIRNGNDIAIFENLSEKQYRLYDEEGNFFGVGEVKNKRMYPLRLLKNK